MIIGIIIGFIIGLITGIVLVVNIKKDVNLHLALFQTNHITNEE